jgi:hypothetical protein
MDELRTYAGRRLELGDMVRAALHLARGCGNKQAESQARELLARLAADTFQLAEAGQALLRGLAARLRRDSEDMRAFALKREAYRSGLVTAEESRAHTDALRRLAGLAGLTQPWADQELAGGPGGKCFTARLAGFMLTLSTAEGLAVERGHRQRSLS